MRKGLMAALLCVGVLPALTGCGSDEWFGEDEAPPLPGKRISILAHDTGIKPDLDVADQKILLPKPQANTSWPQSGGMSNHAMAHLEVGAQIVPAWGTSIGEADPEENRLISSPVIGGGRAYTMDALAHVSAFDATSGATLWRFNLTPDGEEGNVLRGGGLAYENGRLFATTGVGELWAMQAKTGGFYWKVTLDAPVRSAPTVYGGRVFVVTADNKVLAFAAHDGKKLWEYSGAEETSGLLGAASPAADMGVLVVAMRNGALAALRVESGALLWDDTLANGRNTSNLAALGDIKAPPVIANGRVYAIGNAGMMAAIDLRSGRRIWDKDIGGVDLPWLAGDYLYVLTNNNEVVAMEAKTGQVAWVTQLSMWNKPEKHTGRIVWSGPILASDRLLIAGSHGYALAISPYTGKILGYSRLSDGVTLPPVVANGTVYFLTDEANLVAYR